MQIYSAQTNKKTFVYGFGFSHFLLTNLTWLTIVILLSGDGKLCLDPPEDCFDSSLRICTIWSLSDSALLRESTLGGGRICSFSNQ